jgi:hypothetical protein
MKKKLWRLPLKRRVVGTLFAIRVSCLLGLSIIGTFTSIIGSFE